MSVVYGNFGGMTVHESRLGQLSDFVADGIGSVAAILDSVGDATYEALYWAYGEVKDSVGSNASPWSFVGLLGYYREALSGLMYVMKRHYSVVTAQWLTADPISQVSQILAGPYTGRYSYTTAPLTHIDPFGLLPINWIWLWKWGKKLLMACGEAIITLLPALFAGGSKAPVCEAGADCLGAILAIIISALIPVPGLAECIGGFIGGLIGSVLQAWCNHTWNPCEVGKMIISALNGCIGGLIGGTVDPKPGIKNDFPGLGPVAEQINALRSTLYNMLEIPLDDNCGGALKVGPPAVPLSSTKPALPNTPCEVPASARIPGKPIPIKMF